MEKQKIIYTNKGVHTTVSILRTTEDGIYLKCDACGEEYSREIGFYADLFTEEKKE